MIFLIGKRLSNLRKEKELTQEEFSALINISRSTYAQYEINRREPDYEILKRIADFYGVTTDYLLGRTNKRNFTQDDPEDDIQPTPSERYRTFQKKIGELSPESLTFLEFQLDRLHELDLEAVKRRRAERDARKNK